MLKFIHYVFFVYTMLIAVRLIASWFPSWRDRPWLRLMASCTDPYLNLFRRFIPPIGGALDLSPMLGFIVLQCLENLLLRLFH
ncbi:MAG: YggT family protein [Verrucomicrobia bacterium]|nr:YggT family protein [Verrucomicrobiota bacterium]